VSSLSPPRIAFQGECGAFSEEAAIKLLGTGAQLVPRRTFAELFTSVDEGLADYILAPVENSSIGVIEVTASLIRTSSLVIAGEIDIPVEQHLIGCPGSRLEQITAVQSHPAALAQCQLFFVANPNIQKIEADDTAGSVAEVIGRGDPGRAAIASSRAAELYGGIILKKNLEDRPGNHTRFLLLANRSRRAAHAIH
jgi:prephenate dehydratase